VLHLSLLIGALTHALLLCCINICSQSAIEHALLCCIMTCQWCAIMHALLCCISQQDSLMGCHDASITVLYLLAADAQVFFAMHSSHHHLHC